MSIAFASVPPSDIQVEKDTAGGDTYVIRLPGQKEAKPYCFRHMRDDHSLRCTNPAGYRTWHAGTGACVFHGGNTSANPGNITTGRQAKVTRKRLNDQIQAFLDKDRNTLVSLDFELASAKAIYQELVDNLPEHTEENYAINVARIIGVLTTIGNLVEKQSRMETRNALTAAQVLYLRATVADILMKYLPEPEDRVRAARELASRLGGDVSVEMRQSEVYTMPQANQLLDMGES